jgi:hypothetical protein
LAAETVLVGLVGAVVVSAVVQDDAPFGADFPEEAFEQDGQLLEPGGGWPSAVPVEGVVVWRVIQFVAPWPRRPLATAPFSDCRWTARAEYLAR